MDLAGKRVYLAGHAGMVGSAVHRRLASEDCEVLTTTRGDVDLRDQKAVHAWMADAKPDAVIVAAAKVGGILANDTQPADFLYDNLMIECNLIDAAHKAGVQKLLFLGSSCIYPKNAEQPINEEALLTGPLEPTNEPYAISKIAGIKLCESYNRQHGRDYRSVMPTNLYGPNDNFHPENSHVIPALMRRLHDAAQSNTKEVTIWGSGKPMREFLHVDDMASASIHIMELGYEQYVAETDTMLSHINVGTGEDCSIRELAETLALITGFDGNLAFDTSKPDGAPRKLLNVSRLHSLGWEAQISLEEGLKKTYHWFKNNIEFIRS